jgi:hypothetical protein
MNRPQLWFKKTNLETGLVFEDKISCKNLPLWDETPFGHLHIKAQNRMDELNTKMPGVWKYELIEWRIEE